MVRDIFRILKEINSQGLTLFLVEQNVRQALKISDYGYVLENGRMVLSGKASDLLNAPRVQQAYLGG